MTGGLNMEDLLFSLPKKLAEQYGTHDPFKLAEYLGIPVKFFEGRRQKAFCRKILNHCFIFINRNLSEQMQRMSCIHEIAHVLLHREYLAAPDALMNLELFDMSSRIEYEANLFAAQIALPDEEILRVIAREIKKRRESAEIYAANDRPELAETELAEVAVLEEPALPSARKGGMQFYQTFSVPSHYL